MAGPVIVGSAAAQQLPEPTVGAADATARADEILADAQFQPDEPGLVEQVMNWIGDRFASLFEGATQGSAAGNAIGWLVLLAGLGALIYFSIRFFRKVQRDPTDDPEVVGGDSRRTTTEWASAAAAYEQERRWKEAMRCRYRLLVGQLIERDLVPDVPGRTTGEYRYDVADTVPGAADDFSSASELFELAWYADATTGERENREFRTLADQVLAGAGR